MSFRPTPCSPRTFPYLSVLATLESHLCVCRENYHNPRPCPTHSAAAKGGCCDGNKQAAILPSRGLTVGFPVRHLSTNLLARHLATDVPHSLLIEPLCLLLPSLAPRRRPAGLVPVTRAIRALQVGPQQVQRDGQDDGGVMLACDLAHRLEEP